MKLENNWRNKSIQALEKKDWGEPKFDSYLVKRCFQLSKIPLDKFTVEDLRLMIGQGFALEYLMILALEILQNNILAEGDYYPGDLLKNVIDTPPNFWIANHHLYHQLKKLILDEQNTIEDQNILLDKFLTINVS